MQHLENLNLYGNQLTSLPKEFCQLTSLKGLDVWGNAFTSIPDGIGKLENLRTFHIQFDQLAKPLQQKLRTEFTTPKTYFHF